MSQEKPAASLHGAPPNLDTLTCLALENEHAWEITDTQSIPFPLPGNDTHSHAMLIWMIPLHCLNGDVTDTFQKKISHEEDPNAFILLWISVWRRRKFRRLCYSSVRGLCNHICTNIPDYFFFIIWLTAISSE